LKSARLQLLCVGDIVALFTGAWIEMRRPSVWHPTLMRSRSLRARGLKYWYPKNAEEWADVALFTGAWIEIKSGLKIVI